MLHDPSHHMPPPQAVEANLDQSDKDLLRALASELAEIAALPVQQEKARFALDCDTTRIGSGGCRYTSQLPGADFDPGYVHPHSMRGCFPRFLLRMAGRRRAPAPS
ncbi:MAG: hypothetical protein PHO37_04320 [Kiritimatiellae bacterium]|nr:hypothetical protein [Kiritimatiellia bacterium]